MKSSVETVKLRKSETEKFISDLESALQNYEGAAKVKLHRQARQLGSVVKRYGMDCARAKGKMKQIQKVLFLTKIERDMRDSMKDKPWSEEEQDAIIRTMMTDSLGGNL